MNKFLLIMLLIDVIKKTIKFNQKIAESVCSFSFLRFFSCWILLLFIFNITLFMISFITLASFYIYLLKPNYKELFLPFHENDNKIFTSFTFHSPSISAICEYPQYPLIFEVCKEKELLSEIDIWPKGVFEYKFRTTNVHSDSYESFVFEYVM